MGGTVSPLPPRLVGIDRQKQDHSYFVGESSLYLAENLQLWWKPVIAWSGFIIVLLFTAFCINAILRKQWIEAERLSYPIIELPQQMTTTDFFRNRLMWAGFILAGGMDLINGLHFLFPVIPRARW